MVCCLFFCGSNSVGTQVRLMNICAQDSDTFCLAHSTCRNKQLDRALLDYFNYFTPYSFSHSCSILVDDSLMVF